MVIGLVVNTAVWLKLYFMYVTSFNQLFVCTKQNEHMYLSVQDTQPCMDDLIEVQTLEIDFGTFANYIAVFYDKFVVYCICILFTTICGGSVHMGTASNASSLVDIP